MPLQIGKMLVENKLISEEELSLCVDIQKINAKDRIGAILRHFNFIDDLKIAEMISEQVGWPLYKGEYVPNLEVFKKVDIEFLTEHQIYPLKEGNTPVFVLAFIDDVDVTDVIRAHQEFENALFRVGVESEIRNALDLVILEENRKKMGSKLIEIDSEKGFDFLTGWMDNIINLAIMHRSTDIHIEPSHKATEIRFRTDGILVFACCVKKDLINPISNIILARCQSNPSEFNKIHDGRFEHSYLNRIVDIRFSQIPTMHGPSIVLRLLDKARASFSLKNLGYSEYSWALINQAIRAPYGIILVTGPTGCGKSTTLYSMLNYLKTIEKKILTIEDPVEMTHSLITQVQVNPKQDITFSNAIRGFLRHDPDVILVGEIRDAETAQESVRAAITGHQIFSTMHTNDNISALLRLMDLGVDGTNISSSLVAVISQRLVRKLCKYCKSPIRIFRDKCDVIERKYINEESKVIYKACGCPKCINGYWGRTVIAEVLLIDEEIKKLIGKNDIGGIFTVLKERKNYKTMMDNANELLKDGVTSLDEIIRILG